MPAARWDLRPDLDDLPFADRAWSERPAPGKRTLTQFLAPRGPRLRSVPAAPAPPTTGSTLPSPHGAAAIDPFDFSFADPTAALHQAAQAGVDGSSGGVPFYDQLARAFGPAHDLSGISAHVGGAATKACAALGAEAYATGTDVAFRTVPDLHTVAHEVAHVIQQRAGIQLLGGVGEAGDAFERHADAVADRVVAGESAADLLAPFIGGHASAASASVQRKTDGGGTGGGTTNSDGSTWTLTITTAENTDRIVAACKGGSPDAVVIALFIVAKDAVYNATTGKQEPITATAGNGKDFLVLRGSDHQFLYRFKQPPRVDADMVKTIFADSAWGSGHGGLGQDEASGAVHDQFKSDWTDKIDDLLTVFGPLFSGSAKPQPTIVPVRSDISTSYKVAALDEQGRNLMVDPVHNTFVVHDGKAAILCRYVNDPAVDYWQLQPGKHDLDYGFPVDIESKTPLEHKWKDDKTVYQVWTSFHRPSTHEFRTLDPEH